MIDPQGLYQHPNALSPFYSKFAVQDRLLLTGHSHQAWPDCGFEGQCQAWLDAAEHADQKWTYAFAKADRVRRGFARLLDDSGGHIALASNTHELVVRFLSALPIRERRRIVTTDGEYHTIRRQLDRLAEENIDVVRITARPTATLAERLVEALDERTAAVLVSSVLYESGHIVPGLGNLQGACKKIGAELLVDAYHSLNVVPFSLEREGLQAAFVVGGGYKYCQLGEGNCFLRIPEQCNLRPVITGWFSEFDTLAVARAGSAVSYGEGPARFAGSTYDPTSHYRAAAVFDFFDEHGLTPERLREVSRHQVGLLVRLFDELDADPKLIARDRSVDLDGIGGFLALHSPRAGELCRLLNERGVFTDYRGDTLRLGPAPYLSDRQLTGAVDALGEVVRSL
ncbi:MAG: kynureninase [Candidatus Krumholzibacteria bacterium]